MKKLRVLDLCSDCPDYFKTNHCMVSDFEESKRDIVDPVPKCVLKQMLRNVR